jgi:hypothetical protein
VAQGESPEFKPQYHKKKKSEFSFKGVILYWTFSMLLLVDTDTAHPKSCILQMFPSLALFFQMIKINSSFYGAWEW